MALYDWNHDGKKNGADNFIEYQIYEDVTGSDDEEWKYSRHNASGGDSTWIIIVCIIALIFAIIIRI